MASKFSVRIASFEFVKSLTKDYVVYNVEVRVGKNYWVGKVRYNLFFKLYETVRPYLRAVIDDHDNHGEKPTFYLIYSS
jgi:hypothetical protein